MIGGAELIGWRNRNPHPGGHRDTDVQLVDYEMATTIYPAAQQPSSARVILPRDGSVRVQSAPHESGTGTYTCMTQTVSDALGLSPEKIRFELGDTEFLPAPVNGGSWLTASVGSGVRAACDALRTQLIARAQSDPASPFCGMAETDFYLQNGRLGLVSNPNAFVMEATVPDLNTGRVVNVNLAEYHVPVNTDSPPEFSSSLPMCQTSTSTRARCRRDWDCRHARRRRQRRF
jgi:xanthine dehydrogenase YagR molybdenum-binding subunit